MEHTLTSDGERDQGVYWQRARLSWIPLLFVKDGDVSSLFSDCVLAWVFCLHLLQLDKTLTESLFSVCSTSTSLKERTVFLKLSAWLHYLKEIDTILNNVIFFLYLGHLDGLALIDDKGILINLADQEKSMDGASHLFQDRGSYILLAQESELLLWYGKHWLCIKRYGSTS